MAPPRVEFHVLGDAAPARRLRLAARLAAEGYLAGERVLVSFDGNAELADFDALLWTFEEGTFVPHEPWNGREAPPAGQT